VIPIGLGLAWAGYTIGAWGYCLIRGYDVTFMDLFKDTWPGSAAPAKGGASSSAGSSSAGSSAAPHPGMAVPAGGCPQGYIQSGSICLQEAS
jgi:hypothetical protein